MMSEEVDEEISVPNVSQVENDPKKTRPPNRKKFDEEMDGLQNKIKEKEAELEELKTAGGVTAKELKNLKDEKVATIARRKEIDMDLDKLNRDIPDKMRQLSQLASSLYYKSEEKINTAIQRLEWNLKVQTFKLMEEKKIVSEIDSLKRSKRTLVQYLTLKQEITVIRDRQRRMREERDTYFRAVSKLKVQEEKLRKDCSTSRGKFAAIKREIDELYERKRQLLASYKKQKEEFYEVKEKQRQENWRKREDNRKFVADDKRKQQAETEPEKPFEKEINICNALVKYLSQFNSLPVQEPSIDSLSPASSVDEPELAEEIDDGQYVLLKKSEEFEGLDYSGGAKRLSKKNKRPRKQSMVKKIKHSPVTIEQFVELGLSAPNTISEVSRTVESLMAKKAFFEREQQPSEVASDAGISATESTICEMSRQASKTESCEGAVDTHPGEQVYADLLYSCQDGPDDQQDDWEAKGAVGGSEDNSDILSPNSDSTVEGDSGSNESQSSVGAGRAQNHSDDRALSTGSTSAPDTVEESDSTKLVQKSNVEWPHGQQRSLPHPRAQNKAAFTSTSPKKEEVESSQAPKLEEDKPAKYLDCRPKIKYLSPNDLPKTHQWGRNKDKPATQPAFSAPLQSQLQGLSISSPLDFPSLTAAPPAAVSPSGDRSICGSVAGATKSASSNPAHPTASSHPYPPQTHRTLAARLSNPSPAIPSGKRFVTQTFSVPTQLVQPSSILNSEDFPPLSQATSRSRRGSSISTKSSSESSVAQEQVLQAITPTDSQASVHSDKVISAANISGQASSALDNPNVESQLMQNAEVPHCTAQHISLLDLQPSDSMSMSHISAVDKSSTEKWVESSVAFVKDFSPIRSENTMSAQPLESTKL